MVSMAAQRHVVPFVVVAGSHKNRASAPDKPIPQEISYSPFGVIPQEMSYSHVQFEPMKHRRHIPQTFVMTLDAPDLMDYYWIYLTGVAATCMQMSWKHRISMGCFNCCLESQFKFLMFSLYVVLGVDLYWLMSFCRTLRGGGDGDKCIRFWSSHPGACLNLVDTQVYALLWNKNGRKLLHSHRFAQNQLTLWKYASVVKMAALTGHTSRVLYMPQ
ncbi:hypothetical protein RJ641_007450, partial [Dillenia turbinata]